MTTDSRPAASTCDHHDQRPGPLLLIPPRPMIGLTASTAVWVVGPAPRGGFAWIFFVKGSSLLFSGHFAAHSRPGGMQLYASYPGLQIGPLAFAVAEVIRKLGPDQGLVLAQLIMSVVGLLTVL